MPELIIIYNKLLVILANIPKISFKELIANISLIYYFTIFFWLIRVIVYNGITLINLTNIKHSTQYKHINIKFFLGFFLKFYNLNNYKNKFIKLFTIICL